VKAGAETGLVVSVTEIEHQEWLSLNGLFLGPTAKRYAVFYYADTIQLLDEYFYYSMVFLK
jgi:hypothetical protein